LGGDAGTVQRGLPLKTLKRRARRLKYNHFASLSIDTLLLHSYAVVCYSCRAVTGPHALAVNLCGNLLFIECREDFAMSEHKATVEWKRGTEKFSYESYNRDHVVMFDGGVRVPASAAPAYRGNPGHVDPESGLVAALSSCHMLTFLAIAAKKQFVVDGYRDQAVGFLEKNAKGKLAVTRVILHPKITFAGTTPPTPEQIAALHERAHAECFIANSVTTEVTVEGG
jgi:organic hydroperoxide reductase OsmC/OhrA